MIPPDLRQDFLNASGASMTTNRIRLSALFLTVLAILGCSAETADRGQRHEDSAESTAPTAAVSPAHDPAPAAEVPSEAIPPDFTGDASTARLGFPRNLETSPEPLLREEPFAVRSMAERPLDEGPFGLEPPMAASPNGTSPKGTSPIASLPSGGVKTSQPFRLPAIELPRTPRAALELQPEFQPALPMRTFDTDDAARSVEPAPRVAMRAMSASPDKLPNVEQFDPDDARELLEAMNAGSDGPSDVLPAMRRAVSGSMAPDPSLPSPANPELANPELADPGLANSGLANSGSAGTETAGTETAGTETAGDPSAETPDFKVVEVFYGTDRLSITADSLASGDSLPSAYYPAAGVLLAGLLLQGAALLFSGRRTMLAGLGVGCLAVAAAMGLGTLSSRQHQRQQLAARGNAYSNERGKLELGACRVSIPRDHQVGSLEAPSLLRLEIREDVRKHVVLREVERYDESTFYDGLRERVAQSPQRDLFIFVHGYNVTFEDAARRTAQMAHDLQFPGAPIFFSWPSQGGLLKYTVDETNVAWTVPHLKQFLIDVSRRSGAHAVNLVAHSMGNRALTQALLELRYELQSETALFNQVVLAAPDIDAEIFRRDIAPAIQSTARRVTLYASSDDQALMASRSVHGYARAGDSGAGLVVIPGIETIDVSGIDTSLLGHEYYGNSHSILADLYDVIRYGRSASQRSWLLPMVRDGLKYWRLKPDKPTDVAHPPLDGTLR
jgi:esterase/lipase superfamily enzyme